MHEHRTFLHRLRGHGSRLRASTAGNFATFTALAAPVAIGLAALAVDEGALYLERRHLQSIADLAAIAAAAEIDDAGNAAAAVLKDYGYAAELGDDGFIRTGLTGAAEGYVSGAKVTTGHYTADPDLDPAARFVAGGYPANAVHVSIRQPGKRYFSAGFFPAPAVGAQAVAGARNEAAFSVGSRLARIDGGVANALLGALTGGDISLTVMDYEALISGQIGLLDLFSTLNTDLALKAADYADVLASEVTVGQIVAALASNGGLSADAKAAAGRLSAQLGRDGKVFALSRLFELGALGTLPPGHAPTAGDPHIGAMELLSAAAALAIAQGGNQVRLDLGANVPGLLDVKLALAIGEPAQLSPWFAVGDAGAVVRTAQTRMLARTRIGGPGGILGTSIELPIYLELAHAEARLSRIACPTGQPDRPQVTIAARPGVAMLRIADVQAANLAQFERAPAIMPARLVSSPLIAVSGHAEIEIANSGHTALRFNAGEIERRTLKRVATTDIAGSLTQSLLSDLEIEIKVAGLGLGVPGNLSGIVANTLAAATPAVDTLLSGVLGTLGVALGEADVRVHGAICGRAALVQ